MDNGPSLKCVELRVRDKKLLNRDKEPKQEANITRPSCFTFLFSVFSTMSSLFVRLENDSETNLE